MTASRGKNMNDERKLMQFCFIAHEEICSHYHQDLDLFYVIKGEMNVQIDEVKYALKSGDFILINANKRHTLTSSEDMIGVRFVINFRMLAEYMGTMELMFWCNTTSDKNHAYGDVRRLLDRILERHFEQDDRDALYLNALYYETVYLLTSNFMVKANDARLETESTQDRNRVRQIQNYIQANYDKQISLNNLAEKLYLSNAYLSKYIKRHMGLTFLEYLNNVRLFHAVDELIYTEKNLTHIAMDNGFPTSAAFTKAFRDMYGEAPSEYRKKIKSDIFEETGEENLEQKEVWKQKYIKFRAEKNCPQAKELHFCEADAQISQEYRKNLSRAINVGNAYLLLQSEIQDRILEIKNDTGMKYVRMWNVLTEENCVDDREVFNFRKLNQVLDFLLENGMKPYIDLGHKQESFMYDAHKGLADNKTSKNLYTYDNFTRVIRELSINLVNRYGIDEVESWYFEFWNDPKLCIEKEDGEYFRYFDVLYKTLKNISPDIKVGGAGFILGYETMVCEKVFSHWKNRKIHPDFLSFYSYQYIAFVDHGTLYGRKSIDVDFMTNQLEIMKNVMDKTGFSVPEIHINEWNFTVAGRTALNDSCGQGAYIMKTCIDMTGKVDFMSYWKGMDLYSEEDLDTILIGDSGMVSRDGIRKPSYYAFQFMNRLLPNILKKDENCIITTNGRGHYVIACHNYKKLTSRYVFTNESEITIDEVEKYQEDTEPLKLRIKLHHVKNGSYEIKTYNVNKKTGNVQEIWRRLDYSRRLVKDDIDYIKNRAVPNIEMKNIEVKEETMEVESVLEDQEICLMDIRYRYD